MRHGPAECARRVRLPGELAGAAPAWLRSVSLVFPLRYLNDGMLDVMVRGEGPLAALAPMAMLLGFALVIGLLATRLFRWEAD